jgi:hypothetical protein
MQRTHERVLAEGTFRLVLTDQRRLVAALDADTALGAVHVVVNVDHGLRLSPRRASLERSLLAHDVGFSLSDIGDAAESAFKTATKVAPIIAAPALTLLHGAAQQGAHLIAQHASFLPADIRNKIEAAGRVLEKAKLGDIVAQRFIGAAIKAARDHVPGAKAIADKLLEAHRLIDQTKNAIADAMDPRKKAEKLVSALGRGDWHAVRDIAHAELSNVEGAVSMIPGLGTTVAAALAAGDAAIEGGKPLEIAIRTAYGALPIPPGLRTITDAALEAVLALIAGGGSLTDAAMAAARSAIPEGPARSVFDALAELVERHAPVQRVGVELLDQFVKRYAAHAIPLPFVPATHLLPPAPRDAERLIRPLFHAEGKHG